MREKILAGIVLLCLIAVATISTGADAAGFSSRDRYAWNFKSSPASWAVIHRFYKKTIKWQK